MLSSRLQKKPFTLKSAAALSWLTVTGKETIKFHSMSGTFALE